MSLSLNCLIHSEVTEKMFTVKIPKTENVSILKDLIKEKKAPHFDHIAASDLVLWMVDLDLDELGAGPVHVNLKDIKTCQKLHTVKRISSIFDEALMDEHVHILVQAPTGTLHKIGINTYLI